MMRFSSPYRWMALVAVASRSATSLIVQHQQQQSIRNKAFATVVTRFVSTTTTTRTNYVPTSRSRTIRFMSASGGESELKHIGWEEMDSILDEYEELGRETSRILVLDVRNEDEIAYTGQLSPSTKTLPLPAIMQYNLFAMSEEEFEEVCGFPKPTLDETLVFSCAAGIRSVHAAKFAKAAGYSNLVNYVGGANEWFSR